MAKRRWNRWKLLELPSSVDLSCGCSACDEPGGSHGGHYRIAGFVVEYDFYPPTRGGARIMRVYRDGTMRHVRCGRISEPIRSPVSVSEEPSDPDGDLPWEQQDK